MPPGGLVFSLGAVLGALFAEEPPELPAAPTPGESLEKEHTAHQLMNQLHFNIILAKLSS